MSGRWASRAILHCTMVVTVSRPPESIVKLIDVNSSLFRLASLS